MKLPLNIDIETPDDGPCHQTLDDASAVIRDADGHQVSIDAVNAALEIGGVLARVMLGRDEQTERRDEGQHDRRVWCVHCGEIRRMKC